MKTHAELGARLLSSGSSPVLQMAAVIAGDAPRALGRRRLPEGALRRSDPARRTDRRGRRRVRRADARSSVQAGVDRRATRSPRSARGAGSQFDPRVVTAFLALRDELASLLRRLRRDHAAGEQSLLDETPRVAAAAPARRRCSSTSIGTPRGPKFASAGDRARLATGACAGARGRGARLAPSRPRWSSNSASCTAFVAAPLRRLSATIHRSSARSWPGSRRMRPTNTSSLAGALDRQRVERRVRVVEHGHAGRGAQQLARALGRERLATSAR